MTPGRPSARSISSPAVRGFGRSARRLALASGIRPSARRFVTGASTSWLTTATLGAHCLIPKQSPDMPRTPLPVTNKDAAQMSDLSKIEYPTVDLDFFVGKQFTLTAVDESQQFERFYGGDANGLAFTLDGI